MNEKQARNGPSWRPALEQIVLNMQRDTIVTKASKFTAQKILETSKILFLKKNCSEVFVFSEKSCVETPETRPSKFAKRFSEPKALTKFPKSLTVPKKL